jgi:hypothetical protein
MFVVAACCCERGGMTMMMLGGKDDKVLHRMFTDKKILSFPIPTGHSTSL